MKYIVNLSRIIVGVLFIISGAIKLNDPMGLSFKLEEYFAPDVLNLPFLAPYVLGIALFLVVFEVMLGIMLLLGYKSKFTIWCLLLMIVFFTFLTFYSAYFNKVTDCGCFGDAIKLTPWESFSKDVVLLLLILVLFFGRNHIKPFISAKVGFIGTVIALAACVLFADHVLNHLPVIDFRPYKIGANIGEGMIIPEDAPKPIYEYSWKFKVDGEEKIIKTNGDYPSVDGEFIDVETEEIQKGYEPPVHDFSIEKGGEDHTEAMLAEDKLVMVISYNMRKASEEGLEKMKAVTDKALADGYKVIGMSASGEDLTLPVLRKYDLNFEFYFTDETTLKTIVRSNPGILKLHRGTIVQKLHFNDADELETN
ncbi:BT_3928 family protein [Sinomicrobium weinanense]|uniref:DoxX family protein n=1 Tax=Sinomicrobium weinanense TaxID=2842200 RepID=A0A926JT56_9FLAO|nr:BT_3928 family protein [Sinomicrobium weinanense]MBC9797055.1 DoxX family protein [Sinomicrobium weinanense]MBU3122050.1 DoxX family protein [Sinomicrobium weinanense]